MDDEQKRALDEFFASAEDVLTDWHGSPDAMSTIEPVRAAPHFGAWGSLLTADVISANAMERYWLQERTAARLAAILEPPTRSAYLIITGI